MCVVAPDTLHEHRVIWEVLRVGVAHWCCAIVSRILFGGLDVEWHSPMCCFLCVGLGYLVWMLGWLCCWWFKWLGAIRAMEILSPVFSLGCPVEDARLVPCLLVG